MTPTLLHRPRWVFALVASSTACSGAHRRSDVDEASLQVSSVTYAMAQQVRWLGSEQILVGRWDGTIGLFSVPLGSTSQATLQASLVPPEPAGIQLLVPRSSSSFVSSGGSDTLLVWTRAEAPDSAPFAASTVLLPPTAGTAVSGLFVDDAGEELLVTGHEHGSMLIWTVGADDRLVLRETVDLRLDDPIDYAHSDEPLRHIRGLAYWKDGVVVAGGEDGGLHQVRLSDGTVLSQRLFNPDAVLGINDLAVHDDHLLVVNCAVDKRDRNLWLFGLEDDKIRLLDAANLLLDPREERIFAFDVVTHAGANGPVAAVSTKEGLVWPVGFADGVLTPSQPTSLGRFFYGNALDYEPLTHRIAAAGISLRVLTVAQPVSAGLQ